MKTRNIVAMCFALLAMGTVETQAQGLGGLLKKVKKGVEVVTGTSQSETALGSLTGKTMEIPIEGGGTLSNPLSKIVDVQLVGAYGKATSMNYGEVSLVFKVKMIANLTAVKFGVNANCPGLMIDQDGNTYKTKESAGWYEYPVTEGVYMKIPLKSSTSFVDVKQTATTIQQLQVGISTSYNDTGLLILKNVPIQWGVEP